MGKKSRKRQGLEAAGAETATPSRSETRRQQRSASEQPQDDRSFLDRYRNVLIGVVAVVGVGLVGYVLFSNATAAAYTCDSLLEAPESQVLPPLPGQTEERLGFVVGDEGRSHSEGVNSYVSCPPTSGEHRAGGELDRDFYGPDAVQVPNDWVHNLEHGYAIIAYKGDPGAEVLNQIRDAMDVPAPTDIGKTCGLPNKVIALRFDDMSEPFAVLAWDRAFLMDSFDADLMTRAAEEFQDGPQAPERAC